MSWTDEQAANDLERYLKRGEMPAIGAVSHAVLALRGGNTCNNVSNRNGFTCSNCGALIFEDDLTYTEMLSQGVLMMRHFPNFCPCCGFKVV